MSRLLDELRADPSAQFETEVKTPDGNLMTATVGPVINGKVIAQVWFQNQPPSEADIEFAKSVMDQVMGQPAALYCESKTPADRAQSEAMLRRFLGGGQG